MTQAHTPGPWEFTGNFIETESGQEICQLFDKHEWDFKNKEANGPLLAASPDLLEALESLVKKCLKNDGYIQNELFKAQEAIKKAKGETP